MKKEELKIWLKWVIIALVSMIFMVFILYFIVPHQIMPIISFFGGQIIGGFCSLKASGECFDAML